MNKIIECKGVRKEYHDGTRKLQVLDGIDMDVYEGEILAICGASGAGKSTLLHLLGTLDMPTQGSVFIRGIRIQGKFQDGLSLLRNRDIGFVFQFYHLLPEFTALENVMMPALAAGKPRRECLPRAEELLAKVGLAERMKHKPGQLSGGEQQRVAIARALFNKPSVVLCDEPTGNLDESTGAGVADLLFELNKTEGVTIVLVTHDMELAARAHRTVTLHEGRVRS